MLKTDQSVFEFLFLPLDTTFYIYKTSIIDCKKNKNLGLCYYY